MQQEGKHQNGYLLLPFLGTIFGMIFLGFNAYSIDCDQVILKIDGHQEVWKTFKSTVREALVEKGVQLEVKDLVKPSLNTLVTEGLVIKVIRPFKITVKTSKSTEQFEVSAETVQEALAQTKITLNPEDKVVPGLTTVIASGAEIRIIKVTKKMVTKQTKLLPETEYRRDLYLEKGLKRTLKTGRAGVKEEKIKIVYEDGHEVKRESMLAKVIRPTLNTIIGIGVRTVAGTLNTSRGTYRYLELKTMDATAYSPGPESCGEYAKIGETCTGKKAGYGLVAVDPRVIPLGTMLYIEDYGQAEAADIGAAIKGNRIDLCYDTYREATMYGRRKVKVYILAKQ